MIKNKFEGKDFDKYDITKQGKEKIETKPETFRDIGAERAKILGEKIKTVKERSKGLGEKIKGGMGRIGKAGLDYGLAMPEIFKAGAKGGVEVAKGIGRAGVEGAKGLGEKAAEWADKKYAGLVAWTLRKTAEAWSKNGDMSSIFTSKIEEAKKIYQEQFAGLRQADRREKFRNWVQTGNLSPERKKQANGKLGELRGIDGLSEQIAQAA